MEQALGDGCERRDASADDRGDQLLLSGEVTEDGALGDPGTTGDLGDRGVRAALGELVIGGSQQQLAVARCVRPERAEGWGHAATVTT